MINYIYNTSVIVKRRLDVSVASRDSFNNPVYGAPTSSWNTVYSSVPCRLAFSADSIEFSPTGERIKPSGTLYFGTEYTLRQEDRIITTNGIEYVVTSLQAAMATPFLQSHWEATVELP